MYRTEHDALGQKPVPNSAYYGIHTQRAKENFNISSTPLEIEQVNAIALIKIAAARVNAKLNLLDKKIASAIEKAANEILGNKFNNQFIVDIYQAGAGTATHMNVNEVIANRALEILKKHKGDYKTIHPNDHVNMSQSTNDVFPTAMRIALLTLAQNLTKNLNDLEHTFKAKAKRSYILKSGRTHLQDAVPILWSQVFDGWAATIKKQVQNLQQSSQRLHSLSIGGTAVGTGINTRPHYQKQMIVELKKLTRLPLESGNTIELTQSMSDFMHFSSALKEAGVELTRISKDIQLLSSGPRTGLNELILPAVEPGSSIMPGKVNPSIPEMLCMVCYQIIGNDKTVEIAALNGSLELNVNMPLIAHNLIESTKILTNAIKIFNDKCIVGMMINRVISEHNAHHSLGLATFLNPYLGYVKATEVAKEAYKKNKSVIDIVRERKLLDEKTISALFDPKKMTRPNR